MPESYCPIALLSLAAANNLLPPQQTGARRERSTETALELSVESVHSVWNCNRKNVATLLSLDGAEARAFDRVSHPRLLHHLRTNGIPEYIVKWAESFLTDRSTSVTVRRSTNEILLVNAGIPQGSPISPVLFPFFNAQHIEECANSGFRVQVGGPVDDVHLIAYGISTETNCRTLESVHQICLRWAQMRKVQRDYQLGSS